MAHTIVCCDVDAVHLATVHVVHGTVGVVGHAGDHQALLCHPFNCVGVSPNGHVPLHLADRQAVLSGDVLGDARLWKRGWRKVLMSTMLSVCFRVDKRK